MTKVKRIATDLCRLMYPPEECPPERSKTTSWRLMDGSDVIADIEYFSQTVQNHQQSYLDRLRAEAEVWQRQMMQASMRDPNPGISYTLRPPARQPHPASIRYNLRDADLTNQLARTLENARRIGPPVTIQNIPPRRR